MFAKVAIAAALVALVVGQSTKPPMSSDATKDPMSSDATKPSMSSDATKPPMSSDATKPPMSSGATRPSGTPMGSTGRPRPSGAPTPSGGPDRTAMPGMDDRCAMRLERCQDDFKMSPDSERSWREFVGCLEAIERCADRKDRYFLNMNIKRAREAVRDMQGEDRWMTASATSAHVTAALLVTSLAAAILSRH